MSACTVNNPSPLSAPNDSSSSTACFKCFNFLSNFLQSSSIIIIKRLDSSAQEWWCRLQIWHCSFAWKQSLCYCCVISSILLSPSLLQFGLHSNEWSVVVGVLTFLTSHNSLLCLNLSTSNIFLPWSFMYILPLLSQNNPLHFLLWDFNFSFLVWMKTFGVSATATSLSSLASMIADNECSWLHCHCRTRHFFFIYPKSLLSTVSSANVLPFISPTVVSVIRKSECMLAFSAFHLVCLHQLVWNKINHVADSVCENSMYVFLSKFLCALLQTACLSKFCFKCFDWNWGFFTLMLCSELFVRWTWEIKWFTSHFWH